jgi:hypothetical protein
MAVNRSSIFALVSLFLVGASGCTSSSKGEAKKPEVRAVAASSTSVASRPPTTGGLGLAVRTLEGVSVSSTDFPVGGGFLVVYADGAGAPGTRVGESGLLSAGVQKSAVMVEIPNSDVPVWLVLHRNGDGNETLDFPGADAPMNNPSTGGALVQQIPALKK